MRNEKLNKEISEFQTKLHNGRENFIAEYFSRKRKTNFSNFEKNSVSDALDE